MLMIGGWCVAAFLLFTQCYTVYYFRLSIERWIQSRLTEFPKNRIKVSAPIMDLRIPGKRIRASQIGRKDGEPQHGICFAVLAVSEECSINSSR